MRLQQNEAHKYRMHIWWDILYTEDFFMTPGHNYICDNDSNRKVELYARTLSIKYIVAYFSWFDCLTDTYFITVLIYVT